MNKSNLNRSKTSDNNKGFTIVELMIATVVFSLVLMICSYAIIHIGRVYYKGVITNRTQDISRNLVNDIVYSIQFGSGDNLIQRSAVPPQVNYSGRSLNARSYCIGRFRYSYTTELSLGNGPNQSPHVLWKNNDEVGDCAVRDLLDDTDLSSSSYNGEILDRNMRIPVFIITPPDPTGMWQIEVTVSYGDEEDFELKDPADPGLGRDYTLCKGIDAGGQFCAVSTHKTNVQKRI